ncbi:TRAM domain-containing protein [Natronomonas gomsonensis]|uniref:TRAM domain-containing protein n=1 Tax=Natronomonas gomsonensis TaxID=1046043 RepID=UPI0020CA45CC|nr:TRAM domain-containing protein [Natronomonas gomsonensis]MCY4731580.1 TRAM domain-containing protein [Natronomonas gomsonensis]
MELPEQLNCLFTGHVEERGDSYVIEIPQRELEIGQLNTGDTYRVALLPATPASNSSSSASSQRAQAESNPPVEEGETRQVEIETLGDGGDGIARVERGYVIIVPDTDVGERVRIEITNVRENVGFANVVERIDYYE